MQGEALDNSDMDLTSGRLRIGITCYPSVGGSGILASGLGEELADRGHEVHFINNYTKWSYLTSSFVPFLVMTINFFIFVRLLV